MTILLNDLAAVFDLEEAKGRRGAFQEVAKAGQLGKVFAGPVEREIVLVLDIARSSANANSKGRTHGNRFGTVREGAVASNQSCADVWNLQSLVHLGEGFLSLLEEVED